MLCLKHYRFGFIHWNVLLSDKDNLDEQKALLRSWLKLFAEKKWSEPSWPTASHLSRLWLGPNYYFIPFWSNFDRAATPRTAFLLSLQTEGCYQVLIVSILLHVAKQVLMKFIFNKFEKYYSLGRYVFPQLICLIIEEFDLRCANVTTVHRSTWLPWRFSGVLTQLLDRWVLMTHD